MIPSYCSTCGHPIHWCQKDGGRGWHRPLDALTGQNGFIVVDGDLHVGTLYQLHVCQQQATYSPPEREEKVEWPSPTMITVTETSEPQEEPEEESTEPEVQQEPYWHTSSWTQRQEKAKNKRDELHRTLAKRRKCPYCQASRGTLCWDMHALRYGSRQHATGAHPERTDNAGEHYMRPTPEWALSNVFK